MFKDRKFHVFLKYESLQNVIRNNNEYFYEHFH